MLVDYRKKEMFERVYNETLKDLPVKEISDDVVASVSDGNMCIISSPTGSGKTLIMPLKIAVPEDERVVEFCGLIRFIE